MKGPIFVTQAFLPGLRKQAGGGVVVHIGGAMDGRVALPFMSAYAATRGALASYVQGANRELAGTDVVLSFFGPVPSNRAWSSHISTCGARWASPSGA